MYVQVTKGGRIHSSLRLYLYGCTAETIIIIGGTAFKEREADVLIEGTIRRLVTPQRPQTGLCRTRDPNDETPRGYTF